MGMVTIDAFEPSELAALIRFVEAIGEHKRTDVPESASEIGSDYAQTIVQTASEQNGLDRRYS
jgi:hypothetical protein